MAINIQEIPRIHCFKGPRINLDDICGDSDKCEIRECLWHKNKGEISPMLGADDNKTEGLM